MATNDRHVPPAVMNAARREYERSRWMGALAVAWFAVPMAIVAVQGGAQVFWASVNALSLMALSAGLLWRGQVYGAAVLPGIVAGAVPYLAPLLLQRGVGSFAALGSTLFFATGIIAGGIVSALTLRRHAGQRVFLFAGCAVAALTGLFGCTLGGLFGVFGMIGGFALFTAPAFARLFWQRSA